MQDRGYLEFTDREIENGLAYAREVESIELSAIVLRIVANETRRLMAAKRTFEDARFQALREHLKQRSREEVAERDAYSHAIASMCGKRSAYARKQRAGKAKRKQGKKAAYSVAPNGQLELII